MVKRLLIYIAVLFVATILVTTSCKKYPDGPYVSLHTKLHRVVGEWEVEYLSINGFDSTTYLHNHPLSGTYIFSKWKEGRPAEFCYNSSGCRSADTTRWFSACGTWDFRNHKNQIELECDYNAPWKEFNLGLVNKNQRTLWQIQRLTEKEMWLMGTYPDGREYYMKLKNIGN
jgi:hypothetical protein